MPRCHGSATLHLTLRGVDLTNKAKGWFATSSPMFQLNAIKPGQVSWSTVHKSSRAKEELNPQWPNQTISCKLLCDCDLDAPIQIAIWDVDSSLRPKHAMGEVEISVSELLRKKVDNLNAVDISKLILLKDKGAAVGKLVVLNAWIDEPKEERIDLTAGMMPAPAQQRDSIRTTARKTPASVNLELILKGVNLEPVHKGGGLFGSKPAPLFRVSAFQMGSADPFKVIYSSEQAVDDLSPKWNTCIVSYNDLCQGSLDLPIMISVVDVDEQGVEYPMGSTETTVATLLKNRVGLVHTNVDASKVLILKEKGQQVGMLATLEAALVSAQDKPVTPSVVLSHGPAHPRPAAPPKLDEEALPFQIKSLDDGATGGMVMDSKGMLSPMVGTTPSQPSSKQNVIPKQHQPPKPEAPKSPSKRGNRTDGISVDISKPSSLLDKLLHLTLEGNDFANEEGLFGCADPFLEIQKYTKGPGGYPKWEAVFRTEHKENELNPKWDTIVMSLDKLCKNDLDKTPLRICVFDWDANGKHKRMGFIEQTVNGFIEAINVGPKLEKSKVFALKRKGNEFGKIIVREARVESLQVQAVQAPVAEEKPAVIVEEEEAAVEKQQEAIPDSPRRDSSHSRSVGSRGRSVGSRGSSRSRSRSLSRSLSRSRSRSRSLSRSLSRSRSRSRSRSLSRSRSRSRSLSRSRSRSRSLSRSRSRSRSFSSRSRSRSRSISPRSNRSARSQFSGDSRGSYGSRSRSLSRSRSSRSRSRSFSDEAKSRGDKSEHSFLSGGDRSNRSNLSKKSLGSGRSLEEEVRGDSDHKSLPEDEGAPLSPAASGSDKHSYDEQSQDSRDDAAKISDEDENMADDSAHLELSPTSDLVSDKVSVKSSDEAGSKASDQSNRSDRSAGSQMSENRSRSRHSAQSGGSRRSSVGSRDSYSHGSRSVRSRSWSDEDKSRGDKSGDNSRRSGRSRGSSRSRPRSRSPYSDRSRSLSPRSNYSGRSRSRSRSPASNYSGRSRSRSRSPLSDYSGRSRSRSRSPASKYSGGSRSRSRSPLSEYSGRSRSRSKSPASSYSGRSRSRSRSPLSNYSGRSRSRSRSRSPLSNYSGRYSDRSRSLSPRSAGSGPRSEIIDEAAEARESHAIDMGAWAALQAASAESFSDSEEDELVDQGAWKNLQEEKDDSVFLLTLRGFKMPNIRSGVWFGGKPNVCFEVCAFSPGTAMMFKPIYKSEHIEGETQPLWKPAAVGFLELCDSDTDKPIQINIYDEEVESGERTLLGSIDSSVSGLIRAKVTGPLNNVDASKTFPLRDGGKDNGTIIIMDAMIDYRVTKVGPPVPAATVNTPRHAPYPYKPPKENSGFDSDSSEEEMALETEPEPQFHEDTKLHLTLYGHNLTNQEGWISTSDPFYQISAYMDVPGSLIWQPVFRSEHVESNLCPKWKPMEMNLDLLCNRKLNQPILISLFDWEESGKHNPMGSFETTVQGLMNAQTYWSGDPMEEIDLYNAFTVIESGVDVGKIVVLDATIDEPDPAEIEGTKGMSHDLDASHTEGSTGVNADNIALPESYARKMDKNKGAFTKQKQIKFNSHGDELSVGSLEDKRGSTDDQLIEDPRTIFGEYDDINNIRSRPWKNALPTKNSGFFEEELVHDLDTFQIDAAADVRLGGDMDASIADIAEILASADDDDDSDDSDDSDSDGEEDEDKEEEKEEDPEREEGELEMMSSMAKSFSHMAAETGRGTDDDIDNFDVEHFDEMFDTVDVDDAVVAEFQKRMEARAKRNKKKQEDEDDADLLRDTPRLILFESEKKRKRKRGKKRKKNEARFSKEFLAAMQKVFGDESDDDDDETLAAKKEKQKAEMAELREGASVRSLFIGDSGDERDEQKEEKKDDDDDDDSQDSHSDEDGESRNESFRSLRSRKAKLGPAEVFAEELKRQEGMKILSTSGLKQEMADMKRNMSRKMMEKELANLRKNTLQNKFSPFEEQKQNKFEDFQTAKYIGGDKSVVSASDKKPAAKEKPKPQGGGLMSHLSRFDGEKAADANRLDDLATVALQDDSKPTLPSLANPNLLNLGSMGVPRPPPVTTAASKPAPEAKKPAAVTSGILGAAAASTGASTLSGLGGDAAASAPSGGGGGGNFFTAGASAWAGAKADEESEAGMGLRGVMQDSSLKDQNGTPSARKSFFKAPMIGFGKKNLDPGVQQGGMLEDDDDASESMNQY